MIIQKLLKRVLQPSLRILSSLDAYHLWADAYHADAHNPLMKLEQDAMLALMPDLQAKRVLDLACGTGRYGRIAYEQGAESVIGVDNSPAMLHHAVLDNCAQASCVAIPLASQSIDVLICGLALGHLPALTQAMDEISRVLVPDGIALISDFHPFQALVGAQRTFSIHQATYAVEHYPHLYRDYHHAAQNAHLTITDVAEPTYQDKPVVLVLKLQKQI